MPLAAELQPMTTEAYIPSEVRYGEKLIEGAFAVTLYDPDSDSPHGSMTTHQPLDEGARGGPLVIVGTRDGKRWRVTLPEIEVCRTTAVGCEYLIFGRLTREALGPA